jgi:hypothetical protein
LPKENCPSTPPDEESVFSKYMNSRVARVERKPDGQVAAVIVFNPDVTMQDATELLASIAEKLESTDVQEFKPEYGRPVLFFA